MKKLSVLCLSAVMALSLPVVVATAAHAGNEGGTIDDD